MAINGDQFLRQQYGIAILLERFAIALALHLGGAIEHRFHAAEFDNQIHAALVADAGRAGYVIDRVAAQRHYVNHLFRQHAQHFPHLFRVENQVVFLRIEHLHLRRDKLHHVLVAGDDEDLVSALGSLARQGADHVVGLESLHLENGDVQRFKRAANVGDLAAQVLGHGFPLGLVAVIAYFFKALRF